MTRGGWNLLLTAATATWSAGALVLFVTGRSTLGVLATVIATGLLITAIAVAKYASASRRYRERDVELYGQTIARLSREILDLDWPEGREQAIRATLAAADEALWTIAGEGSREAYELRKQHDLPLRPF